jgi:hypothetical protein
MRVEELERLASERPLVTAELHPPNDYYGHATLLKRYAMLPPKRPLKVAIEHGVAIVEQIWEVDLQTRMPLFLCAASRRADSYNALADGGRHAEAVGPMIAYAASDGSMPKEAGSRRLVVFPAHSTHHIEAVYDVADFAARLEPYRSEWDEIQVCLYWRDVVLGTHRPYIEHGFDCVTAGHMHDRGFLPRLRSILEGADAVVSNEIGSHMLYAIVLDRPAWLHDQRIEYSAESQEVLERDGASARHLAEETIQTLRRLFSERHDAVTDEQREFVHEVAGVEHVRSPERMRQLLLEAEHRYRELHPLHLRAALGVNARLRHARSRMASR